jgi:uncharacterized protein YprB with RNaseH-like and TPR domain
VSDPAVRDRLARLLRGRDRTSEVTASPSNASTLGPPDGLRREPEDGVLARRATFELSSRHGAWRLEEALAADRAILALLARDPALADADLRRALFLDTETTGLSGGAGTWVFLVGLGSFEDDGFRVWQGFLAEPAEERALLEEVAARIRAASVVVSFFGKAFDRHRLEDKMRMHGIAPPFDGRPHLDLYHPLRRLYRPRPAPGERTVALDARLRTLESELCGVGREDDLPGALAPAAWFDFLHGRPHALEGVFRHNRDDVLSLVALAAHLSCCVDERRRGGEPVAGSAGARARAVACCLARAGRFATAVEWFERAAERGAGALTPAELRLLARSRRRSAAN